MSNTTINLQIDNLSGLTDLKKEEALRQTKLQQLLSFLLYNRAERGSTDELFFDNCVDLLCQIMGEETVCNTLALNKNIYLRHKFRKVTSYKDTYLTDFGKNFGIKGDFDIHTSVKVLGLNVDLIYAYGELTKCIVPYYFSLPYDITDIVVEIAEKQNILVIDEWQDIDSVTIQSKLVLPISIYEQYVKELGLQTDSFDISYAILQIIKENNQTYIDNLDIISFNFICEGFNFSSKTSMYDYFEDLGFVLPLNIQINDVNLDTIVLDIHNTIAECTELLLSGSNYPYLTEGVIVSLDEMQYRNKAIIDGRYTNADILVQLDYWKTEIITGYIQTIYWKQTKDKLLPYAIIGSKPNMIPSIKDYILNKDVIKDIELGVKYKNEIYTKVPLCNPYIILILDAYPEFTINFTVNKYLGCIPCYEQSPLMHQMLQTYLEN